MKATRQETKWQRSGPEFLQSKRLQLIYILLAMTGGF
jgi:hypothetical protein